MPIGQMGSSDTSSMTTRRPGPCRRPRSCEMQRTRSNSICDGITGGHSDNPGQLYGLVWICHRRQSARLLPIKSAIMALVLAALPITESTLLFSCSRLPLATAEATYCALAERRFRQRLDRSQDANACHVRAPRQSEAPNQHAVPGVENGCSNRFQPMTSISCLH